jgi:ribosomal protein L11 methyltransferase
MEKLQTNLTLEAGISAFGDGTHPTTALLLEAMEGLAPGISPPTVLDFGCGSGILALRAAQLWPEAAILGVDCEAGAVAATQANASANGLAERVLAVHANRPEDAALQAHAPYGLITMNILAEPILGLLHGIEAVLAADGILLLSGILLWQEPPIREAAEALGLELAYRFQAGDWVALVFQKP